MSVISIKFSLGADVVELNVEVVVWIPFVVVVDSYLDSCVCFIGFESDYLIDAIKVSTVFGSAFRCSYADLLLELYCLLLFHDLDFYSSCALGDGVMHTLEADIWVRFLYWINWRIFNLELLTLKR